MKNVLITGITGMVGSHLADFLLANTDWKLYGFCRWNDNLENLEHLSDRINKKDGIELIYGDLNDSFSVINAVELSKPGYVFHLAAQSYPKTSFTAPVETLQTNIIGTTNLFEAIKNSKYKNAFIHNCSSSEIFGRVSKEKLPIDEECSFHCASPYSISKAGTDLLGRYYAEAYNMNVVTTRMFTHTGPRRGDVFHESTFAKQIAMIEAGLQEPKIYVGNLQSLRTYADVRDAVRAYHMLLTINPIRGEYYNIGGEYTCTVEETLYHLVRLSSYPNTIEIISDQERFRPIDADLQLPNTTKFRKHTGWKPEISYETTMLDLLNYWRDKVGSGRKFLKR
jgi:GDP-mannose 4,6-dehydratase